MKGERTIAGVACSQVLARLTDYFDGDLSSEERAQLEAHVRQCDHCARFGGVFAAAISSLRARLGADELGAPARARLRAVIELAGPNGPSPSPDTSLR